MADDHDQSVAPTDGARLLYSFVPALMINAMGDASIEPPTTRDYQAVALFAVNIRASSSPLTCISCGRRAFAPSSAASLPLLLLRSTSAEAPLTLSHPPTLAQDISGFSALNEHFAKDGGDGLGQMMSLVNMYFQQMIKITSACGGDVIKFAGDALICLWTQQGEAATAPVQASTVHRAIACAMELQDALHDCPMTDRIRLSLKIGVGIGQVTMFYVGGHAGRCEYFAAGPALRDCFAACDIAVSGDVIVSAAVWSEVHEECESLERSNGFRALTAMTKTMRKKSVNRTMITQEVSVETLRGYVPPVMLSACALEASIGQSLRGWTVSVVQASVLFVNLGIGGLMDQLALDCTKIHVAVLTVQRIVQTLSGCIHRFTVDDKGCVMKVVFGAHLPHEDQPYRALLAALQLRQALSLQGIQPAVGVASGLSLIGPVGSATRQEFTVHGDKIILAARLMSLAAKYGGMVLCDEQTYASTRDDVRFVQLQPVELKGKSAVVRPYRPVASSELLEKPTLSVKPDDTYCASLEAIKRSLDACDQWLGESQPGFRALVVTGAHGAGKSQLLMQARARFEATSRVLHVRCRAHEAGQRGALLRRIFAQLCGHDVWPSLQHITPMLTALHGTSADGENDAEEALVEYELKLLRSHAAATENLLMSSRASWSKRTWRGAEAASSRARLLARRRGGLLETSRSRRASPTRWRMPRAPSARTAPDSPIDRAYWAARPSTVRACPTLFRR